MSCKGTTKVEKHNLREKKKACKAKPKAVWDAQTCRCESTDKGKKTIDVMGGSYTRTDTGKKVSEDTYIDFAHERGYTPSKKQVRKYKRKVRKGKL